MCPNWAQPVKVFAADGRKLRPISGLWAELLTKPRSVRHNPILFGDLLRLLPSIARCCCHYTEKCRLAGKRDGGNCYCKTRAGATDAAGPVAEPSVPVAAPDAGVRPMPAVAQPAPVPMPVRCGGQSGRHGAGRVPMASASCIVQPRPTVISSSGVPFSCRSPCSSGGQFQPTSRGGT